MKKLLLLFTMILSISIAYSSVLKLVPEDSKAVFVMKNVSATYDQMKTVPTIGKFLGEPFSAEITFSSYIEMYLNTLDIKPDAFFKSLNTDMAFFIQEPKDSYYPFGIVFGPVDKVQDFTKAMEKILEITKESNISLKSYNKKIDGKDYVIFIQDDKAYATLKTGLDTSLVKISNGFFFNVNASDLKTTGSVYIKDGFLVGTASGKINEKEISPAYVKKPQDYKFLGTVFGVSGFVPKDFKVFGDIVNIIVDYSIIEKVLMSSSGFELNGNLDINLKNTGMLDIKSINYAKINSKSSIDQLLPVFKDNNIKYEKTSSNAVKIFISQQNQSSSSSQPKQALPEQIFYLWKDGDNFFVSQTTANDINTMLKNSKNLSDNALFKILNSKVPFGNLANLFLDISKLFEQYGEKGEFGLLFSVNHTSSGNIKADFILK